MMISNTSSILSLIFIVFTCPHTLAERELRTYSAEAFRCDEEFMELYSTEPVVFGESIRICVRPTVYTLARGAVMRQMNHFTFVKNNGFGQEAIIPNGKEATDTIVTCEPQDELCVFKTKLNKDFFTSFGNVTGSGEIVLEFADSARNFLRRRQLQGQGDLKFAGVWPITVEFDVLKGSDGGKDKERNNVVQESYNEMDSTIKSLIMVSVLVSLLCFCCIGMAWCCCMIYRRRNRDNSDYYIDGKYPREVDIDSQASFFETFHKKIGDTQADESSDELSDMEQEDDWDSPKNEYFRDELPNVPEESERSEDPLPRNAIQTKPTGKPGNKKGKNKGKNANGKKKNGKANEDSAEKKKNELLSKETDTAEPPTENSAHPLPNTTSLLDSIDEDTDESSVSSTESPLLSEKTPAEPPRSESSMACSEGVSCISSSPVVLTIDDSDDESNPVSRDKTGLSLTSIDEGISVESSKQKTSPGTKQTASVLTSCASASFHSKRKSQHKALEVKVEDWPSDDKMSTDKLPTIKSRLFPKINIDEWPSDDELSTDDHQRFRASRIKIEDWQSDDESTADGPKHNFNLDNNTSDSDDDSVNFYPNHFDVAFGNPDHEGTMVFEITVRLVAETTGSVSFSSSTRVQIEKGLKGRNFYLKEKTGTIEFWRVATPDEVEEHFEKSYKAQLAETEQIQKLTASR